MGLREREDVGAVGEERRAGLDYLDGSGLLAVVGGLVHAGVLGEALAISTLHLRPFGILVTSLIAWTLLRAPRAARETTRAASGATGSM